MNFIKKYQINNTKITKRYYLTTYKTILKLKLKLKIKTM